MTEQLSLSALKTLVAEWLAAGKGVAAPVRTASGKLLFSHLTSPDKMELTSAVRPSNSIKGILFPRHEELFHYHFNGRQVELDTAPRPAPEQIVIGARPCDAAALPVLDHVFNWDFHDSFYNRRREATTVVSVACTAFDAACFCTSVGLGPQDPAGSDAMLYPAADGTFGVRCFTDKGRALFGDCPPEAPSEFPAPVIKFDPQRVAAFAAQSFGAPFWREQSLACVGCGVCAYTCPTCHCFDIVDEGGAKAGARVKNWDSCQFPLFTAHASGHNPRAMQGDRQRQRIFHKFHLYPEKFHAILCTGCGNCARNCPAGLGVLRVIQSIPPEAAR
jgi:ferredoxin